METCLLLDAGSGGRASQRLVAQCFLRHFANPLLERLDDAALPALIIVLAGLLPVILLSRSIAASRPGHH